MKRVYFGLGALVLGLAALMWSTAPANGGRGGHGGGGGGHAAPARVGSVHYASAPVRVAPVRVAPVVRPGVGTGSVHYAGTGGYRTRYRNDYVGRFRPGYLPFVLSDGYQYYGYYDLPIGYSQEVDDGVTYFLFDGLYYRAYIIDGRTVYIVVPNE